MLFCAAKIEIHLDGKPLRIPLTDEVAGFNERQVGLKDEWVNHDRVHAEQVGSDCLLSIVHILLLYQRIDINSIGFLLLVDSVMEGK